MIKKAFHGLRFFVGLAPRFSRIGFQRAGLADKPVGADFSGQTWLVTGASGGIGRQIVAEAARRGARVIAVARNESRLDDLADMPSSERIETIAADLSLTSEVRSVVEVLARERVSVDVVVNNVGVLLNELSLTSEGFETSFATNLLNHFTLTEALIDRGVLQRGAAVINMSSGGMYSTALDPDQLNVTDTTAYDGVAAYAQHKRAQVELTGHWNRVYGDRARFYVMHPGWVDTSGVRTSLPGFRRLFRPILRDAAQGADTAIWLAAMGPEPSAEGIWLDRRLCPEHLNEQTQTRPGDREALIDLLHSATRQRLAA